MTYTGTNMTWVGGGSNELFTTDGNWAPLPPGETYPGPLDNAIISGAYYAGAYGDDAIAGLDLSGLTTGAFFIDGAQLSVGVTPGSSVGGELDAAGMDSLIADGPGNMLTAGPSVDAATGTVNVSFYATYIWEGGGTAASVTQTVDLFDPLQPIYPGVFDAYTPFYGTVAVAPGALINLMPGGPSASVMISAPPVIVGDAIDYSTTDSHGVVTDDTLNLADTHGTVAPYSSTLAVGIDLSAIHISDWSAQTGITAEYAVPDDFNHDGTTDIPFIQTGGETGVWEMSGTSIVGGGDLGPTATGWTPVATGDFVNFLGAGNDLTTPQGWAEFLFQNAYGDYGALEYVDPGNGQPAAMVDIGNPGGNWALKGVGDFNGDGQSDLLLQDGAGNVGIWELNGSSVIGGGVVADPGGTWQIKGVGDFNGEGKDGIVFQDASGEVAIWDLDGTTIVGGGDIGNPAGSWQVVGVGDFNNDGRDDLLFENASGEYAIWELNGTSIIGGGDIGNPGGTWQFAAVGDYTGDGHADILFQDASGNLAIWEMNGTSIVGGGEIGAPGAQWHVLG